MSTLTKYTLDNLPNSFTVFGTACTDATTKNLAHNMSSGYNTFGGQGLKQKVDLIVRAILSNPTFWSNSVGKDKLAILNLWSTVNWAGLNTARRTALFAVTDVL